MAGSAFHLAVIGLAFLHLLARATTAENLVTLPDATAPHCLGVSTMTPEDTTAAGPVAPRHQHAPPPSTTSNDDSSPRGLAASVVGHQGEDAIWSPGFAPPAPRRPCACALDTRDVVVGVTDTEAAPQGDATTKALLQALPLLAVPFLPPPVVPLVALSSLATPARARSDDCFKLHHATCTIYPYDNETGAIDRTRPDLAAVCLHPLCHADSAERLFSVLHGQRHGRGDDILHIYCAVRTLEGSLSVLPWRNNWRVHLPVADPGAAAAAASGGGICYVELAHLEYREGYFIHCPVGEHRQAYGTEFSEDEIAAAVWDHRRLNYRDTVGERYATYQSKYKYDEL